MKIYNSQSRRKEEFQTISKKIVKLYVCGITPNNATHLGHAFTYMSFDILIRYLKYKNYTIQYLQNATDINDSDDVIKQAREGGKTWDEIAEFWISHFQRNMSALNILPPTYYIKASSAIEKIITITHDLMIKGYAYTKKGNVYFDTKKMENYGTLSKFTVEQMLLISKDRGNNPNDPLKRNPLDFVLWITTQEEPFWESPWGKGRPGWHIECSALINEYLGDRIDIHGGGKDLIFPHHESEKAQSEPYSGISPYVNYWMHVGMVLYEGEKMSKSLGNLILIEDLLKKFSPNAIRWLLLSHYWRQPWEYSEDELEEAENNIENLKKIITDYPTDNAPLNMNEFEKIMDNDLYTPRALEYLLMIAQKKEEKRTLLKCLELLGFKF